MRVLFISNSSSGMYSFRKEVVKAVAKRADTFLCAPNDFEEEKWEEVHCSYIPSIIKRHGTNPIDDLRLLRFYFKLIKRINPDVVLTYTIKPNVYAGFACRLLGIKYIVNVTGLGDSFESNRTMRFISMLLYKVGIKKASCVFFQNEANQRLFEKKRIVKGKTKRIPGSGVNLEVHSFEDYPKNSTQFIFLYVARIKKDKGIEELLAAIKEIRKKHPMCYVEIIGPYEEDYSHKVQQAETRGDVKYYGVQKSIHDFYKRSHCVVLPSYHEGLSNVLLEGAATGRPIVTTVVPGCKETFEEGVSGFGCNVRSISSLVDAMEKIISLSREDRESMGRAARRKMENEFDRNIVVNAYLDEIQSLTDGVN